MKLWTNRNFLAVLVLVILSLIALKSLATAGFYTSHDGETHTARIAQYYLAIKDGQFPPRFAGSFYNGLGSPIFVYIYPLPYLLGALIHFFGVNFADSFKLLSALCFTFSAIFTYLWLKIATKSSKGAFLGALFYVWAPYRFSLIYVRASVSELLAYTFIPLIFYSLTKLKTNTNLFWTALSAIAIGSLLLSQNLVALISLPVIGLYALINIPRQNKIKYLLLSLISSVWGLAISAFTFLPAIYERGFVRFDETISGAYISHFVPLKKLIYSPWGYGFDIPGPNPGGLSLQLGIAHILVLILSFVLIAWLAFKISKKNITNLILPFYFLLVAILSIFLMTKFQPTIYVWQHLKILSIIDIPWRLLGITTLAVSFLAAFTAKTAKPGILFIFLTLLVLYSNRNHIRINEAVVHEDSFFENYTGTATQYNEFTPKWRQTTRVPIGFESNIKTKVLEGQVEIADLKYNSNTLSFKADVKSSSAKIRINKFYFPGVVINLDGKVLNQNSNYSISNASALKLNDQEDGSGLPVLGLQNGSHYISFRYGETPLRKLSDAVTILALIPALALLLKNVKK